MGLEIVLCAAMPTPANNRHFFGWFINWIDLTHSSPYFLVEVAATDTVECVDSIAVLRLKGNSVNRDLCCFAFFELDFHITDPQK